METGITELERRHELARCAGRRLSDAVRRTFGNRVRSIRLYGSFARGDADLQSDVDILVLLDELMPADRDRISQLANRIGVLDHGIMISAQALSPAEFVELLRRERSWALAIEREGREL